MRPGPGYKLEVFVTTTGGDVDIFKDVQLVCFPGEAPSFADVACVEYLIEQHGRRISIPRAAVRAVAVVQSVQSKED